jgi:hypothetical protein
MTHTALSETPSSTSKSRALRDLNTHTQPIQEALNHAQASVNRAMQFLQREYLQRRQHILNGHDETESI